MVYNIALRRGSSSGVVYTSTRGGGTMGCDDSRAD